MKTEQKYLTLRQLRRKFDRMKCKYKFAKRMALAGGSEFYNDEDRTVQVVKPLFLFSSNFSSQIVSNSFLQLEFQEKEDPNSAVERRDCRNYVLLTKLLTKSTAPQNVGGFRIYKEGRIPAVEDRATPTGKGKSKAPSGKDNGKRWMIDVNMQGSNPSKKSKTTTNKSMVDLATPMTQIPEEIIFVQCIELLNGISDLPKDAYFTAMKGFSYPYI